MTVVCRVEVTFVKAVECSVCGVDSGLVDCERMLLLNLGLEVSRCGSVMKVFWVVTGREVVHGVQWFQVVGGSRMER